MNIRLKYLDIVVESSERLRKARENINTGVLMILICFIIFGIASSFCVLFDYMLLAFLLLGYAVMYLLLLMGLVLKREIYSLSIFIKDNIEEG